MQENSGQQKGIKGTDACIHCHLCQKNCAFLGKYKIDIGDADRLRELAYHCFLCGTCTVVCPKGIDGRKIILNMRRERIAEEGGKPKGYGMLLWEKDNYKFRNYRNAAGKAAFFPGCNFPSFYPETTKYLSRMLWEKAGIGTVYDCCGKPVAELGMENREKDILYRLDKQLEKEGIEELILACPNCYHFLKGRIQARVVSIYSKLLELGVHTKQQEKERKFFLPCPDRESREMLKDICLFLRKEPKIISGVQCCGLGGSAAVKEAELAEYLTDSLMGEMQVYSYCASCCGNLARKGCKAEHILVTLLGTGEKPDTKKSLLNRVKFKFWKEKEV